MLPTVLRNGILALSGVLLAGVLLPDAAVARGGFYTSGVRGYGWQRPAYGAIAAGLGLGLVWAMGITAIPWLILTTLHEYARIWPLGLSWISGQWLRANTETGADRLWPALANG